MTEEIDEMNNRKKDTTQRANRIPGSLGYFENQNNGLTFGTRVSSCGFLYNDFIYMICQRYHCINSKFLHSTCKSAMNMTFFAEWYYTLFFKYY